MGVIPQLHFRGLTTIFDNVAILCLTKAPMNPQALSEMVSNFKVDSNSSSTTDELQHSFKKLYSYIKDTGVFILKRKSVGKFPKSCCVTRFIIRSTNYQVY